MDKLKLIKINNWIFDPLKKTLTCHDDTNDFLETLEAKHSDLLHCLIEHQGEIVTRDQLIELVWNNRFIDDRTINATVSRLRKILGGNKDEYIKTHPKLGYSFTSRIVYLDRPTPEKVKLEKKETSNLTLFKFYAGILTTLFIFLLWFLLTNLEQKENILTPNEIKIEPLTYSDGWEAEPSLSQDKSLLAFVSLKDGNANYHVTVQNRATKQTIIIEPNIETSSPFWSPKTNELFYVSYTNQQCLIKSITIDNNLQLGEVKNIISCGSEFNLPSIAIGPDRQWLYYTYDEATNTPSIIRKFHFETKQVENLTAPSNKLTNDSSISLNTNNLAFIRIYGDMSTSLMLLNITSGELIELTTNDYAIYSIAWTKSPDYLSFIDELNTLYLVNIHNNKITPVYKNSKNIGEQVFISENELLLSVGDLYKANIKKINLNTPDRKIEPLISSPFKDHSADIYLEHNGNDTIAFVSNRSGNYQIWLQQQEQLLQLTHFSDPDSYITDLVFSANGKKLLFKFNDQLQVITLATQQLIAITQPSKKMRNAIWACNSNDTIIAIGKSTGIWAAYKINIATSTTKKLIIGVTSIHSNCKNQQYIVTKQNQQGLLAYNYNGRANNNKAFFTNRTFTGYDNWAVANNKLYQLTENGRSIIELELKTRVEKTISLQEKSFTSFTARYNIFIFSSLLPNDTFIGKITIPKITETIIPK